MKDVIKRIHTGLAWLIVAGSVLQFFLISLSVFGAAGRELHSWGGLGLMITALLLVITALIVRVNRANVILSIVTLILLVPVQGIFIYMDMPNWLRAMHGVNGVLIMALGYHLAHSSIRATAFLGEAVGKVEVGAPAATR